MARKILLADDSVTAQNMGRKILADAGYDIVTVNNGSAALKRVAEINPDLIVLDVYMPGYSGLEVCQRLKDSPETNHIPVLLTVGKLEPFKADEARRVRADGHIVKPFEASELLTAITRLEDRMVPQPANGRVVTGSGDPDTGWKSRLSFSSRKKKNEPAAEEASSGASFRDFRKLKAKPEATGSFTVKAAPPLGQEPGLVPDVPRGRAPAMASGLFTGEAPQAPGQDPDLIPDIPRDITPEEMDALSAMASKLNQTTSKPQFEVENSELVSAGDKGAEENTQRGPEPDKGTALVEAASQVGEYLPPTREVENLLVDGKSEIEIPVQCVEFPAEIPGVTDDPAGSLSAHENQDSLVGIAGVESESGKTSTAIAMTAFVPSEEPASLANAGDGAVDRSDEPMFAEAMFAETMFAEAMFAETTLAETVVSEATVAEVTSVETTSAGSRIAESVEGSSAISPSEAGAPDAIGTRYDEQKIGNDETAAAAVTDVHGDAVSDHKTDLSVALVEASAEEPATALWDSVEHTAIDEASQPEKEKQHAYASSLREAEEAIPSDAELVEALRLLTPAIGHTDAGGFPTSGTLVAAGRLLAEQAARDAASGSRWMAEPMLLTPEEAVASLEAEMNLYRASIELSRIGEVSEIAAVVENRLAVSAQGGRDQSSAVSGTGRNSTQQAASSGNNSTGLAATDGEAKIDGSGADQARLETDEQGAAAFAAAAVADAMPADTSNAPAIASRPAEQVLKAMAAAAAEGGAPMSSADASTIASIVDSVMADLRPKIVEEITRKLAGKGK